MGCNNHQVKDELTEAGNKLLDLPSFSSTHDIITILQLTENNLSTVSQSPPKSLIKPLHQMMNALIAKELMMHPDMNVNISVACCICEILRITAPKTSYNNEQIKDFFELVVVSFGKLFSTSGGYYGKMTKVLEVFSKARLPILMMDLKQDGHGLIVRLFKHFLNVSDFESTAIVLNMENIMRMIVEESEKLAIELQDLLLSSVRKDNQSGSPVCWQFGEKVLMICSAKVKPIDQMSIAVFDYPKMVAHMGGKETIPFISETSKMIAIDKIKLECPATINTMQTLRHCRGTPMASKSVTEVNGNRKRNNEQAPFVEHGDILVGRWIRVWQAKDEIYRLGVVKSFDVKYNMHKVLFDDGLELVIDLKLRRWMFENLFAIPDSSNETQESSKEKGVTVLSSQNHENERLENENLERSKEKQVSIVLSEEALFSNVREVELVQAGPAPREGSSPQSGIICVQGYKVKNVYAPILEAILKKHGDIAATCVFKTSSARESILEVVCDVVTTIQTNDVTNIISSIDEIESQVYAAEAANFNVSWLRAHLEAIRQRNEAGKKVSMLMELKTNTSLVKRAAGTDLNERRANLVAAQNQYAQAKRCVEVLELVEKKVNDNVLESKAEKDLWAGHQVMLDL